jgi:DNA-3-methyladenine glycosylase I
MLDINNIEVVKETFLSMENTLRMNFKETNREADFNKLINWALNLKYTKEEDNEYFNKIKLIVFYSGFSAEKVDERKELIDHYFPNYSVVMNYTEINVKNIMSDINMIKNRRKIYAIIENAKEINEIVKNNGSVFDYLNSFSPNDTWENLLRLKEDLEIRFSYLGKITVYHFLTDIGLNVLKPDRVITRIFKRLGLINSTENLLETITIGRKIAEFVEKPIRYIDLIFVLYGQEKKEGICLEKTPSCNICKIKKYCEYC